MQMWACPCLSLSLYYWKLPDRCCQMWRWISPIVHNNLYSYLIFQIPQKPPKCIKIREIYCTLLFVLLPPFSKSSKWLWNLQQRLSRIVFQPMFQLCSWPESPWEATTGQAWLSWYTDALVFIFICSFLHRSDHMLMHLYMPNDILMAELMWERTFACWDQWNQWDFFMDRVSDAKDNKLYF